MKVKEKIALSLIQSNNTSKSTVIHLFCTIYFNLIWNLVRENSVDEIKKHTQICSYVFEMFVLVVKIFSSFGNIFLPNIIYFKKTVYSWTSFYFTELSRATHFLVRSPIASPLNFTHFLGFILHPASIMTIV